MWIETVQRLARARPLGLDHAPADTGLKHGLAQHVQIIAEIFRHDAFGSLHGAILVRVRLPRSAALLDLDGHAHRVIRWLLIRDTLRHRGANQRRCARLEGVAVRSRQQLGEPVLANPSDESLVWSTGRY